MSAEPWDEVTHFREYLSLLKCIVIMRLNWGQETLLLVIKKWSPFWWITHTKILLKVVLLVYIWLVIEKLLSHLNQMTIVKKKVGFKILELETTKEQAITRALLSWGTIAWQINAIFFFRSKTNWYVTRYLRYVCKNTL